MLKTEAGAQRMVGYVFSSIDIKRVISNGIILNQFTKK
jgi:hypothetical protein